jgi:Fe-S-cluster containining protein
MNRQQRRSQKRHLAKIKVGGLPRSSANRPPTGDTVHSADEAYQSPLAKKCIETGKNILHHYLDQARAPEAVFEIHPSAHQGHVYLSRKVQEIMSNPLETACSKGCSYCCHLLVLTLPHELFTIATKLRKNLSPENFQILREHIHQTALKTGTMDIKDRERTRIPCSLLKAEGICGVYPVRPMSCVGFNSMSKERCQRFFENPYHPELAQTYAPPFLIANGLSTGIMLATHEAGLDATALELNRGLDFVLEDLDGHLERWLRGERIFEHLQCIPDDERYGMLEEMTHNEVMDAMNSFLKPK